MASPALRFCIALNAAALLSFLAFGLVPEDLDVRTDIVGYPTYANFNINRYFWAYGFAVVLFPLLTFGIYLALTRVFARSQRPRAPDSAAARARGGGASGRELASASRRCRADASSSAAYSASRPRSSSETAEHKVLFVPDARSATAGWHSSLPGARRGVATRDPLECRELREHAVAAADPRACSTASPSRRRSRSPPPVRCTTTRGCRSGSALALTAGVAAWLVRGLLTAASSADLGRRSSGRRSSCGRARRPLPPCRLLPGELGTINLFEEGQVLAGARELTRDGAFPWRDLLVVHGLVHDVGTGSSAPQSSRTAAGVSSAGEKLLILPLSWVALYYLCVYLFGSNWLFLLGTQLLVVTGQIFVDPLPARPHPARSAAARGAPPPADRRSRGRLHGAPLRAGDRHARSALGAFPRTCWSSSSSSSTTATRRAGSSRTFAGHWLVVASAGVLAARVGPIFLLANGALDDFVFSYRAFVPGHQLTGGRPARDLPRRSAAAERRRALRGVRDPRAGPPHPRRDPLLRHAHALAPPARGLRTG